MAWRLQNDTLLSSRHGLKNPFLSFSGKEEKEGGHSLRSKDYWWLTLLGIRVEFFSHPASVAGKGILCENRIEKKMGEEFVTGFCCFTDTSFPFEIDLRISI